MWQEDDTINYSQSSEPSSPRPSTVATLPSSTLPANLISRPAAYTIGTKSRSYSNDPSTPSHAHLHHLPLRTHSHRKSTSVSSNASSTGTTGTAGTAGTGISTSRVTFADQVAFPPGQEPDLVLDEPSHFLEQQDTHTMDTKPALSVATDMAVSPPERSPLSSSSTSTTPQLISPTLKRGLSRTSSLRSTPGSDSTTTSLPASTTTTVPGDAPLPSSLSRQSSLSLNLGRKSSMSKKNLSTKSDRDSVPPSPSSAHRGQRHVMLNRRSVSQDFSLRLQQQQQKQDELGEELSEAGEDIPGTPSSVSSFGSASASVSTTASGRNRLNRNSVALIESRNQTLSSNLAMVSSPTDSEFPQQTSESLLSVIAQKEARIAQLREDLETNLSELTQLKERWSQMMMEERNRQQAEASASIQQQEEKLYGHSSAQSVSHRLSTTGAGLWGSVVGSVSGISGVSGGISLHNINSIHHHHHIPTDQEPVSQPKRSQSKGRINREGQRAQSPSRPTSPLPAYLSGFSSLNGLDSPTTKGTTTGASTRGDRASVSSLSTCSSSLSNDGPTAFEAGHSSQSSFSSAGGEHSMKDRESRRTKRESSGLFIPPEAEEVLVNTGRALFKGFGSLIGGIRTVVNDVAESDRFQHSRQRTMDMVTGLAQTAADALPLPSHDDIYYHHQRLNLLDEEDEEGISQELLLHQQKIQLQQAKEQRRLERLKEKERRMQERSKSGDILDESLSVDSSSRPGTLVRRSSSRLKAKTMGESSPAVESLSKNVSQLSIHEELKKDGVEEEAGGEWDSLEDKALMAALEETLTKKVVEVPEADLLGLGLLDTPNPSSKKDD